MNDPLPLISIAIPAYNESENIDELVRRLQATFQDLSMFYNFEVVVCENGSVDDSWQKLSAHCESDTRFKIVRLVRNFHMEGGMMAALAHVSGDACIIMSADLQDPPEMIPQFLEKWEEGYENVYSVITKRHGEGIARRVAAQIFYWLINRISDRPVPRNSSDFRLISRLAYQSFNALPERNRMVRATWGWLGFKSTAIFYERSARFGGKSTFNPIVTAGFAVRGILASSSTPLKIIPALGTFLSGASFFSFAVFFVRSIFFGVPFPGWGTIVSLLLLMFGFLFLLLGMIAEYIDMIFREVQHRPSYIVHDLLGLEEDPPKNNT
jgi:polyisoprenyl-phosphate glycosyltransferase